MNVGHKLLHWFLFILVNVECLTAQHVPNDPLITNQWHHEILGSYEAWQFSRSSKTIRVAILDEPFQMDHPDLAANTAPGWDATSGEKILSHTGEAHATLSAGLIAAAVNNSLGIAGMGNCQILPVKFGVTLEDMYRAIIWCADNGVRVVNISYDGAYSAALNEAGRYLKQKTEGVLVMSGLNTNRLIHYPNHPFIQAISMTDRKDQPASAQGGHIDFACPGVEVFSTTTNSAYAVESGTSFSAPIASGIIAVLFSINPALTADGVLQLLRNSAVDLGAPGRDDVFGWGRLDFAKAAKLAFSTRPDSRILRIERTQKETIISLLPRSDVKYRLWKSRSVWPSAWEPLLTARSQISDGLLQFLDPEVGDRAFYRMEFEVLN